MITERKKAEREARKKLIIQSALSVFKEKGLEHATMDEIAHKADFGKATLYYYFKSKDEIFNTILFNGWQSLWEGIEEYVVQTESPRQTFIAILKKLAEMVNENRKLYEFLFFAPQSLPVIDGQEPGWKQFQVRLHNTLLQLIEEAMDKNELPTMDSQLVLKALGGVFHGMLFWGSDRKNISETDIEKFLEKFIKTHD